MKNFGKTSANTQHCFLKKSVQEKSLTQSQAHRKPPSVLVLIKQLPTQSLSMQHGQALAKYGQGMNELIDPRLQV